MFLVKINTSIRKHLVSIALTCLGILVAYLPFWANKGLIGNLADPIAQTVPNKLLLIQYIKSGILPLWNPFIFMGFPFLADIQVGTFYIPDFLIFSLFNGFQAHNISVLFHLMFAAIGIYFLTFKNSKSRITSIALSLMMVLSGSFLARIVYLNFLEVISFIPWLLILADREKPRYLLMILLWTLMILAGHPIALFYSLIIIFGFYCFTKLKQLPALTLSFVVGLFVSAVQLIPFWELKGESVRSALDYAQFTQGSLHWSDLSNLIFPSLPGEVIYFDHYIYMGGIPFLLFVIGGFFIPKLTKKHRQIYVCGLILFVSGVLLSLGGSLPELAKITYNLPVFNLLRVPVRYFILAHFGIFMGLIAFTHYLVRKKPRSGVIIMSLLIINALITPYISLKKETINDATQQYQPELLTTIEAHENKVRSLNSIPKYFISSNIFVVPNRHMPSLLQSVIGYNPLMLQRYYDFLPVSPRGHLESANYFTDYTSEFELIGLRYYVFPTLEFLDQLELSDKAYIIKHLQNNGWKSIGTNGKFEVWENPNAKEFAYLLGKDNKILNLDFKPGKIEFELEVSKDDTLVVNQTWTKDWYFKINTESTWTASQQYSNIVQSYEIPAGTTNLLLEYRPKSAVKGLAISLLTIFILIFSYAWKKRAKI